MKILLIITKSEIGGAQIFVLNLARSLKKLGHDIEVAAGEGDYLLKELEKQNITYYYLNSLKRDFSIFSSLNFIYSLYRLLKIKEYDIVHLNSSNTIIAAVSVLFLKKKPKILYTFHGLSFLEENYNFSFLITPLARIYFRFFLKMIDKLVFVSKVNYDVTKKANITQRGEVIYNGLDENELNFLDKKDARNFFSNKYNIDVSQNYLIGSIGRIAHQKNYEFLINNFKIIKEKVPNVKILIIGTGPYLKKLNNYISRLGIRNNFFFIGPIEESYKYIKAFDIFTLPSRYEGLSISLIEAVFAGVPILASNVGGNTEIVNSEQIFRLNDINDYIDKLLLIKQDPLKYHNINCHLRYRFTLDKMKNEYYKIYGELSGMDSK